MNRTTLRLRLRALLNRRRAEADLQEELEGHLQLETRKLSASGLDPEEARRQARIAFGAAERVKEECRDARGTRWLETIAQDARFGLRMLFKDRGYTLAAIGALAVGIGANTLLFTIFNATVLRPLPVADPGRLVSVYHQTPRNLYSSLSFAHYAFYRDHNSVFESIAAEQPEHLRMTAGEGVDQAAPDPAEPLMGLFVTANYFRAMGVFPIAGRTLFPEDDRASGPLYPALISENFWERRFHRDQAVLGRALTVSGTSVIVVGITPRDFRGTRPEVPDFFIAVSALGDLQSRARDRITLCCQISARLKPGVSPAQAEAQLSVLAATLRKDDPPSSESFVARVTPAQPFGPAQQRVFRMLYALLQVVMALVLLIACANVAGLLLGRAAARQREIAVRLSVGATRGRLVRQLITESLLIAILSGSLALAISSFSLALVNRNLIPALGGDGGSLAFHVAPDLRVFLYMLVVSIAAGISFALAPALNSTRPDLVAALKGDTAGFGVRRKGRLRGATVAAQIAVCLTLLIGAGLLARRAARLVSVEPGIETHRVISMSILDPQLLGYAPARQREIRARLNERLCAFPGLASVSFASRMPLGEQVQYALALPKSDRPADALHATHYPYSRVTPEYFSTVSVPLLAGRTFTAQEIATDAPVVVISEALARSFWPGENAVGRRIAIGSPTQVRFAGQQTLLIPSAEVVGIVRDVYVNVITPDPGTLYLPNPPGHWAGEVLLRSEGDIFGMTAALAAEVRAVDPALSVSIATLEQIMAQDRIYRAIRVGGIIFTTVGLLGFALAGVGVYSMVAYAVAQQRRELGIRMALGARRSDVVRAAMEGTLRWIALGVATGVGLGVAASTGLSSVLYVAGQKMVDGRVVLAIALATALLAAAAAYLPARKATRLDPSVTLRME